MGRDADGFLWDVLGLGCVAVDDLLYVPAYPPPECKVRVRRRERQGGGLTGTALVAAARLGARCAFAGVLGDDEDSRFVEDCFRRDGVDTSPIVRRPAARPIRSTVIVDEGRHTRTIFFDLAGSTGAEPEAPPAEVICAARVLFVDHYGVEGMTRAARIGRAAGLAVVGDLERDDDRRDGMISHVLPVEVEVR
ncbi:MAG TPA: PfkB family carbohydrate kinase [Gemmataceae bacterium]|nr:PfkB family carbohydrate kinase [Gemmataceae bacterium]